MAESFTFKSLQHTFMKKTIYKVASRASGLAFKQAHLATELLQKQFPSLNFDIQKISTHGDRRRDRPLSQFGGMGVFVKEIEQALLNGEVDFAVHSLKDVPTKTDPDLELCAFPKRELPNDLFLTRDGSTIHTLKKGAVVGTGSPRRQVLIRGARPDVKFLDIRGNIDTRLSKLQSGQYDAIVLAAAGFRRAGRTFTKEQLLPIDVSLPAIGQGVLVLQCRKDDTDTRELLKTVTHHQTELEVKAERMFMKELGGGCQIPVAAFSQIKKNTLYMEGMIGDISLERSIRMKKEGEPEKGEDLAKELARDMLERCERENIQFRV